MSCKAYFHGYQQLSLGREPTGLRCGCCDIVGPGLPATYYFKTGQEGGFSFGWENPWLDDTDCSVLTDRMSLLPCSRLQGSYVQNNTLRICSSACDTLFNKCGLPGENLASSYNYTDGRSLCYNAWGGLDGSSSCDYSPDGALCQSGIEYIEVVDGDDCLGAESQYPHCDSSSGSSGISSSKARTWPTSYDVVWLIFAPAMLFYSFWQHRRRIQRRREGEQDAAADTLPIASATPVGTSPEPATQSMPVAAAVPEPPVTSVVQATAIAPTNSAAASGVRSIRDDEVATAASKQLTFDQEMDIQSLEFKLRMEMITQEQFDEAKREIMNQ